MAIARHSIHVYQLPKLGTGFIRSYDIFNYQHTIVNRGWFDTASCDIAVRSEGEGQQILNQYLGCFVQVYVDNPAEPVWEGLINRITFNAGDASYTVSLDEMANRVSVIYTGAANAAAETTPVNNAASQAIYGIKQEQIEFGADPSAGTQRTVLQNTILAQRAFPQASIGQASGQANLVHFECIGIFHTLEWQKAFSGLTSATTAAGTWVGTVLGTVANGATFFDNTNLTLVSANAATIPNQVRGENYWNYLQKIADMGDGTNYWVCGVTPTNPNTGKRLFYYRIANTAFDYTALQADGLKPRNASGKLIPPWRVIPDRSIRYTDALTRFSNNIGGNPTETYIQSVQYDANSQRVQWFGADDTTARAAFLLNRSFLPIARDFGAPARTIAT